MLGLTLRRTHTINHRYKRNNIRKNLLFLCSLACIFRSALAVILAEAHRIVCLTASLCFFVIHIIYGSGGFNQPTNHLCLDSIPPPTLAPFTLARLLESIWWHEWTVPAADHRVEPTYHSFKLSHGRFIAASACTLNLWYFHLLGSLPPLEVQPALYRVVYSNSKM